MLLCNSNLLFASNARFFVTTERHLRSARQISVDPNGASLDGIRECECGINIFGENASGQTVISVIGTFDDLIQSFEFENALNWTENLD